MALSKKLLAPPLITLEDAIKRLDLGGQGILCITDETGKLLGIITDGDIRRSILKGIKITDSIDQVMNRNYSFGKPGLKRKKHVDSLISLKRRHLPIIDEDKHLLDIILLDEFAPKERDIPAVLMVGGMGTRLGQLTKEIPKPMLPVGDSPLLENIILNLKSQGFKRFYLCTHHKSQIIRDHFGDGDKWGVDIKYTLETAPMGTAGALSLLTDELQGTFIVMNGDVLTQVSFKDLLHFHEQSESFLTVVAKDYDVAIPFGVLEVEGQDLVRVIEKPTYSYFTNAGIYVLEREALEAVPENKMYNMTDLMSDFLHKQKKINVFPLHEKWLDIGRPEDYFAASGEKK